MSAAMESSTPRRCEYELNGSLARRVIAGRCSRPAAESPPGSIWVEFLGGLLAPPTRHLLAPKLGGGAGPCSGSESESESVSIRFSALSSSPIPIQIPIPTPTSDRRQTRNVPLEDAPHGTETLRSRL